jgi:hypothetical protein
MAREKDRLDYYHDEVAAWIEAGICVSSFAAVSQAITNRHKSVSRARPDAPSALCALSLSQVVAMLS